MLDIYEDQMDNKYISTAYWGSVHETGAYERLWYIFLFLSFDQNRFGIFPRKNSNEQKCYHYGHTMPAVGIAHEP